MFQSSSKGTHQITTYLLFSDGTDFELCMGAWGATFRLESPMWFCSLRSLEGKSLSLIRRGPVQQK